MEKQTRSKYKILQGSVAKFDNPAILSLNDLERAVAELLDSGFHIESVQVTSTLGSYYPIHSVHMYG